jgi:hypothetical protein
VALIELLPIFEELSVECMETQLQDLSDIAVLLIIVRPLLTWRLEMESDQALLVQSHQHKLGRRAATDVRYSDEIH